MPIGALFRGRSGPAAVRVFSEGSQARIWPLPNTTYFCEVRPSRPTGRAHAACRRNADLRAQPYSKPSAKRVDAFTSTELESTCAGNAGRSLVFGDDRVGMLRSVLADVLDRRAQIPHHAHREDGREVLGVPVLLGGGLHAGNERARFLIAAQLHALVGVDLREPGSTLVRFFRLRAASPSHCTPVALRLRVVRDEIAFSMSARSSM